MCSLCVVDALIDNLSLQVYLICSRESGSNVCDFVPNSLLLLQALRSEHNLSTSVVSAMSVTDSEPNFRDAISKYAFSSSYVPGAPDEQPGGPPSLGVMAMLRRLLHESFAMTSAELKASVERVEDAPIRKWAQPERADRLQRQKARLVGLRIEGRLEPSDRLVDAAVAMYEENRVSYLELSKCTSKDQEVLNSSLKEDRHMTIDHHGVVRLKDKEMKDDVNISTDMFLRLVLMRRGLALEQANILDYLIHDRWVERIFDVRSAEQPEGYAQVSQQQVISADKKLFIKLAEFTRSGIQLQPSGRPADTAFVRAMEHPDVWPVIKDMLFMPFFLCAYFWTEHLVFSRARSLSKQSVFRKCFFAENLGEGEGP